MSAREHRDASRYRFSDVPPELRAQMIINPGTGCWEWQFNRPTRMGIPEAARYAAVMWDGKLEAVHRVIYRMLAGPIPDGHEIDHVYAQGCRCNACCWPAHLEPVTKAENSRRATRANIHKGVASTVQQRIAYGCATEQDLALADAVWMLPFPATHEVLAPAAGAPDPRPEDERYLITSEAARILCVPEWLMKQWRRERTGPRFFYAGRRALYRRSWLIGWVEGTPDAATQIARGA